MIRVFIILYLSLTVINAKNICPFLSAEINSGTPKLDRIISILINKKGWNIVKKTKCSNSILSKDKSILNMEVAIISKNGIDLKITYLKKDKKESKYNIDTAQNFMKKSSKNKIYKIDESKIKNKYNLSSVYINILYMGVTMYELGDINLSDTELINIKYNKKPEITGGITNLKIKEKRPHIDLNKFMSNNLYLLDYYNPTEDIKKLYKNKKAPELKQDIINFVNKSLRREKNRMTPEEKKMDKIQKAIQVY